MRLASLGSGSGGNATLVEGAGTRVLIDCGFGPRVTRDRLRGLGVEPESLDAIVLTHEHHDHVRGVEPIAAARDLPVFATPGTARAWDGGVRLHPVDVHRPFAIGGLTLEPFPVVHDAAEPFQVVIGDGRRRFGVLTDSGICTPHILERLAACDALLLEANHDPAMLRAGPYPRWLQARVSGRYGHLDNGQAGAVLGWLECARLQLVLACHVSRRNNTPAAVRGALEPALADSDAVLEVLAQAGDARWHELV